MVIVDPSLTAETLRLRLRPLLLSDAPAVFTFRSDPDCMLYTSTPPTDKLSEVEDWIQTKCLDASNCYNYVAELKPELSDTGEYQVVGLVGAIRSPELGYGLMPRHQGKGYMREALEAYFPLYWEHFSKMGIVQYDYATLEMDPEHTASIKVAEHFGFQRWEHKEHDFFNHRLGWRDTLTWRLPRPGMTMEEVMKREEERKEETAPKAGIA